MDKKPSYYSLLPAPIRYDRRLSANAKIIYSEIEALSNQDGFCWATNTYFAERYHVNKQTISRWLAQLAKYGYITLRFMAAQKRRIYLKKTKGKERKEMLDKVERVRYNAIVH